MKKRKKHRKSQKHKKPVKAPRLQPTEVLQPIQVVEVVAKIAPTMETQSNFFSTIKQYPSRFARSCKKVWDWSVSTCKKIKGVIVKAKKDIDTWYKVTQWKVINRRRKIYFFFQRHFDIFLRIGFVLIALIVGILISRLGGKNFTQEIVSNYLTTIGAMTGGTIAIVFTISLFLIQNAADLYSSQYLEVYVHNWQERLIYFVVISITILFFGGGLLIGSLTTFPQYASSYIVICSLVLIGVVFALIDWQYKTVRQKTSPVKAILFLEKQGIRFLDNTESDAKKIAAIIKAKNDSVSENEALAVAYNSYLKPHMTNLDRQIENLVEISMKLADRNEIETPKRGFTAVHNILAKFFELRKTSSVAIPSSVAILAIESDSQQFLTRNFERLNKAGERFINEKRDENATYLLNIYNSLAIKCADISFIGRTNENPILETLVGNLEFLIDMGVRAKNLEVVFQGVGKLKNIALIAAEKGYQPILIGIQKKILELGIYGLTEKQTVIVDVCNSAYLDIIFASFTSKKIIARYQFDTSLKNIATLADYIFTAIGSKYLLNDIGTRMAMTKAYDNLYTYIVAIVNYYPTLTDDREKDRYRSDIAGFFDELYRSLRSLAENIKNCDGILADSIGRLLNHVNDLIVTLLLHDDFADVKAELTKRLSWNVHLPFWFAKYAESFDGSSNAFNSLVESVAQTGILAFEKLKDKELVSTCADSIYSLTKETLKKTTAIYGYDEPRVLEKACYLGILALKNGWEKIATKIGFNIYEFEAAYKKKHIDTIPAHIPRTAYGLPKEDQLYRELSSWRYKFDSERWNGNLRIRDDAEAMMYSLIETIDIDRFTFEIWEIIQGENGIEEEIEEKFKKKAILKKITTLIKAMAQKK